MRERPSLSPWTSFALTVKVFFWSTVGAFVGTALFYVVAFFAVKAHLQKTVTDWASGLSGQRQPSSMTVEERPRTVALGEPVTVGGIRFTGWRIEQASVRGTKTSFGTTTPIHSAREMLILHCTLENVSEGDVIRPVSENSLRRCGIVDRFENRMAPLVKGVFEFEDYTFEGQAPLDKEITPGETLRTIIIACPPKIADADPFLWRVRFHTSNKDYIPALGGQDDKEITLSFTRDDIKRQ